MSFRSMFAVSTRTACFADWFELGGRALGALGGVVAGALLVWRGVTGFGNNPSLALMHLFEGVALVGSAFILLFATTAVGAVIGLVIALVVAIIQFVTILLESDELQIWLNRSHYFGAQKVLAFWHFQSNEDHTPYASALKQRKALVNKVLQGA